MGTATEKCSESHGQLKRERSQSPFHLMVSIRTRTEQEENWQDMFLVMFMGPNRPSMTGNVLGSLLLERRENERWHVNAKRR